MTICEDHLYVLGECPSCDADPRPLIERLEWKAECGYRLSNEEQAQLSYQKRRLPMLTYLLKVVS